MSQLAIKIVKVSTKKRENNKKATKKILCGDGNTIFGKLGMKLHNEITLVILCSEILRFKCSTDSASITI